MTISPLFEHVWKEDMSSKSRCINAFITERVKNNRVAVLGL